MHCFLIARAESARACALLDILFCTLLYQSYKSSCLEASCKCTLLLKLAFVSLRALYFALEGGPFYAWASGEAMYSICQVYNMLQDAKKKPCKYFPVVYKPEILFMYSE